MNLTGNTNSAAGGWPARLIGLLLILCLLGTSLGIAACGGGEGGKAPKIVLPEGLEDASFEEFQPVTLSAIATNRGGETLEGSSVHWTSDLDGPLGSGTELTLEQLSSGVHTITVTATDAGGHSTSKKFRLTVKRATGLIPRGSDYLGRSFYYSGFFWAAVTVRDASGNSIPGLSLDDFTLTESIINAEGEPLTEPHPISFAKERDWQPQYFWEESLSRQKIDVVFLVERRGTMRDEINAILEEALDFVDRLVASHLDFRVAAVNIEETPEVGASDFIRFHGVGELDRLRQRMDDFFITGGTWWNPVATYDSLLWTPWLGFRPDARKVVIILSDIQPQTIYDAVWYSPSCTATTRSAVEWFLAHHPDMEVYYSLDPAKPVNIDVYFDPTINPMAGNDLDERGRGSGLGALEARGFVRKIAWPFREEDIPLESAPIADSTYYFIWETGLSGKEWDLVVKNPDAYRVRVELQATLPKGSGELSTVFTYPVTKTSVRFAIRYKDERGRLIPEKWVYSDLSCPIGSRTMSYSPHMWVENGLYTGDVFPGRYLLTTLDWGPALFNYQSFRCLDRRMVEIPPDGLTLDLVVPMAEREMWLAIAYGLVHDLDENWRLPGDPFGPFAAKARGWLDSLDREGIGFLEMVRLRRFIVALSGYASTMEYAQREIEEAIANVRDIVDDIAAVIAEVRALEESTDLEWQDALGALLEIGYDILTGGSFTINKELIEKGLEALIEYAARELIEELIDQVCDKLKDDTIGSIVCALVDVASKLPSSVEEEGWDAAAEAIGDLALDAALDAVRAELAGGFVDQVFSRLDISDALQRSLAPPVKDLIAAVSAGRGISDFGSTLEKFGRDIVQRLGAQRYAESREKIADAIGDIFEALRRAVEAELGQTALASQVNGWLLGIAEDSALAALPAVKPGGKITYNLDGRAFTDLIITHTLCQLVLNDYFVGKAAPALEGVLDRAMSSKPSGADYWEWQRGLSNDFRACRQAIAALIDNAWDALETQKEVKKWAEGLSGLVAILEPLGGALDFMAALYPPLEDTAKAVHGFTAALDAVQIIPEAIELGLRIDSLQMLGQESMGLGALAFGSAP